MPFIGAAIAAISTAFTAFAATSIGTFLTTTFVGRLLVSVGASALIQALSKPKSGTVSQPGIKTEVTQTGGTNPLSFVIGTYATAGTMICPPMSHGNVGGTPNAYLTYVIDLGDIAGQTLSRVIINGEYVTLGTPAHADYGLPVTGRYADRAWIKFYDGSQTVADPMLLAKYGSYPERPWAADMIGRGVPYAILTFRFDRKLYNGFPTCKFEVGGIPLYDPRLDSTVGGSGGNRWGFPDTWSASANPFVAIYNIMRGIGLADGSVWGGNFAVAEIDDASFIAAMNECDRLETANSSTTETQFRCGLEISVDQEPADVIAELLKSCAGQVAEIGGTWKARAGGPGLPVLFITDDDIIVTKAQDLSPFPGLDRSYNGIHASFPDPSALWAPTEGTPIYNPPLEAEDQGRRLIANLALPAVPFPDQVQRLMSAYIAEERRFARHGLTLPPYAAILEPLDVISWTSAKNGYATKLFEVSEVTDDLLTVLQRVALRERDSADYIYPAGIFSPAQPPSDGVVLPPVQYVPGWAVAAEVVADNLGTARRPALRLSWDPTDLDDVSLIQWEVRVQATGIVVTSGSTADVDAGFLIVAAAILPNVTYEARARIVVNRPTAWSAWVPATTPDLRINDIDIAPDYLDGAFAAIATSNADIFAANQLIDSYTKAFSSGVDTRLALTTDLPYETRFENGAVYWRQSYTASGIAAATSAATDLADVALISVDAAPVLQFTNTTRNIYENGMRPFVDGEVVAITVRARKYAGASAGRIRIRMRAISNGAGANAGYRELALKNYVLADGYGELTVTFNPVELRDAATGWAEAGATKDSWKLFVLAQPDVDALGGTQSLIVTRIAIEQVTAVTSLAATLTQDYTTTTALNTAISSGITSYDASVAGGLSASATFATTVLASLDGTVARFTNIVTAGDDVTASGIEAYAWDGAGIGTGSVLKLIGDNVIAEGTLTAASLVAKTITSDYIEIAGALIITNSAASFQFGKASYSDYARDGFYFGGGGGANFGFLLGKITPSGLSQSIRHTTADGLEISNARFSFDTSTITPGIYTSSQTLTLSPGVKSITMTLFGGGGGGDSGNGGNTLVELYDGVTNTGVFWTGVGGAGGGNTPQRAGQNSARGTGGGGYRASYVTHYNSSGGGYDVTTPAVPASGATGYAAGGGGNTAGGAAAVPLDVTNYDISALTAPKLVITIGAAGSGTTNGSPGILDVLQFFGVQVPANVLPLRPTTTGSFIKAANATGAAVFPDLGPGMWVLYRAGGTLITSLKISSTGDLLAGIADAGPITFVSDIRPDIIASGAAATISYSFYSMQVAS